MVLHAEYSPDKKRIISSQYDGSIKIWDADSGRLIRSILAHKSPVFSTAWSPNGKMFLSCDVETLKVWNAETCRELWSASGYAFSAVFSPDGKIIAAGTENGTVKLLNAATGKEFREINDLITDEDAPYIFGLCFNPEGKQLAVSNLWELKIFNVSTGALITTLANRDYEEGKEVSALDVALAFSPDGKRLAASGFGEKNVIVYDVLSGNNLFTLSGHEDAVNSAAFNSSGTYIATGSVDKAVKIWDSSNGKELHKYDPNKGTISSVSFKDNRYILAATAVSIVEINAENGEEVRSFSGKSNFSLASAFSPQGNIFFGKKVWLPDGSAQMELEVDGSLLAAAYSPDGKILAVLDINKIIFFDIEKGLVIWEKEINFLGNGDSSFLPHLTFSKDGKRIASGSPSGNTLVWDVQSGELIYDRPLHNGVVTHVDFSIDGLIASGGTDGILKIWNENTLIARPYPGFDDKPIKNFAFNPDGKSIAVSFEDNIMLLDVQSGKEIWTTEEIGGTFAMAYNPQKKQILVAAVTGPRILNAETGEIISKLPYEGSYFFNNAVYSPDGKYFYISTLDGNISKWDAETNREIAKFISFEDGEWIVITSDGYYNASANGDRYINLRIGNKVYGIDQYREIFYRPEIVQTILAGNTANFGMNLTKAALITPPVVNIKTPGDKVSTIKTQLQVSITDQNNPIQTVRIMVNGRLIGKDELPDFKVTGLEAGKTSFTVTGRQKKIDFEIPVNLTPGAENIIEVFAFNGYSWSSTARTSVVCESTQPGKLPNLWILAIGINRYKNIHSLEYCVPDAQGMVDIFKKQEGIHYARVNSLLIADNSPVKPTAANMKENMKSFLSKADPNDVAILFLAGHGVDVSGSFVFLPSDAQFEDGLPTDSTTLSSKEILDALDNPCRRLVFIDACHSGGVMGGKTTVVNNDYLLRALEKNNAFIFTAATNTETAAERWELEHGVFTYNILEGLSGKANPDGNTVRMLRLTEFVTEEVQKKTNYKQNPTFTGRGFVDFPVVRTK